MFDQDWGNPGGYTRHRGNMLRRDLSETVKRYEPDVVFAPITKKVNEALNDVHNLLRGRQMDQRPEQRSGEGASPPVVAWHRRIEQVCGFLESRAELQPLVDHLDRVLFSIESSIVIELKDVAEWSNLLGRVRFICRQYPQLDEPTYALDSVIAEMRQVMGQ